MCQYEPDLVVICANTAMKCVPLPNVKCHFNVIYAKYAPHTVHCNE